MHDINDPTTCNHAHNHEIHEHANESKTLRVVILTLATMLIEVAAGYLTGSMALLADGWHMGTHAFALGITWLAYILARRHAHSPVFSFGTGKFGILAGYTSALFLGVAALSMLYQSAQRLLFPVTIAFNEAIVVAILGLVVNAASIAIMHGHGHGHGHNHQHDHSFRAAYLHVIADALTSILAIAALLTGKYLGWAFLDPVMGMLGGVLILRWAWSLLKQTGHILLDGKAPEAIYGEIRTALESDNDSRVTDLRVWYLGSHDLAALASVDTGQALSPGDYRQRLEKIHGLHHITVEVHHRDLHTNCCKA
ncbi:metal ion efflux pump, CDF family, putative [Syntrophotalea carbinolica DSM 2380]|uniref:Metal ion efflux pump, CDF family, putative n=1 Tax=Syntrophotalea carbinolica (strain DSM 2380 / NBRC 103641 / GraBd1) TaxID=338963 RepID=Q3A661_SYNC1|nr:CDF family Co(II)/Ni(II) efflux transporter DmeF [Syntrophotalea carbinolica]ABA88146.1 metal ion efflux pump, CDF family, putative [Syntrophotalea carbinolica DSM 2380]